MNDPANWPVQAKASELITIVLPAYNEQANILPAYNALRAVLRDIAPIEIIFVDDGSSDGTAKAVRQLRDMGAPVRLVRFGRNFGQQAALFAGLERAAGGAVITMDCDLQHPPEVLPRMIEEWRRGGKVVQMVRVESTGVNLFKKLTSKLFYEFINLISETPVLASAADFQLLDRDVVNAVLQFRDRNPFLRGLVAWLGYPSVRLEYIAAARHAGATSYTFRKMVRLSIQAITGLSSKPLRMSLYLGLCTAAASMLYVGFALYQYIAGAAIPGWTSVIFVVTFLGAVQLLSVGILGEYVARIYEQSRGIPRSIVIESDDRIPEQGSVTSVAS